MYTQNSYQYRKENIHKNLMYSYMLNQLLGNKSSSSLICIHNYDICCHSNHKYSSYMNDDALQNNYCIFLEFSMTGIQGYIFYNVQ